MNRLLNLLTALSAAVLAIAQPTGSLWAQSADYRFVYSDSALQDRIAYLLTLLESDSSVRALLARASGFQGVERRLRETRENEVAGCQGNHGVPCR